MFRAPQAADLTSRTMSVAQWPKILGDVPKRSPDAVTATREIVEEIRILVRAGLYFLFR
jgi:hypothetical protein